MGRLISFLIDIVRYHKLKVLTALLGTLIFAVARFPYDDLSEVVTTLVAEQSGGRFFVQFDSLGFQLIPYPSLAVNDVTVESSVMPEIQARRLSLVPSLLSFIKLRSGMRVQAEDIWGGDLSLNVEEGAKDDQGQSQFTLDLNLSELDLNRIGDTFNLPLRLQGQLSANSTTLADPSLRAQPEGTLHLKVKELRFQPATVQVPLQPGFNFPLSVPGMAWEQVQLKGNLKNGRLTIEQLELAGDNRSVHGSISGTVDLRFEPDPMSGQVRPRATGYDLALDLNVPKKLEDDLGLTGFLGNFRSPTESGGRYRFALKPGPGGSVPVPSPLVGG